MEKKKFLKVGIKVFLLIIGFLLSGFVANYLFKSMRSESYESSESFLSMDNVSRKVTDMPTPKGLSYYSNEKLVDGTNREKNIIKSGDIKVLADDIDKTLLEVEKIVKKYNAETQSTYEGGKGKFRNVNLVYKVKVSDFESFFNELKDMDVELDSSSSSVNDVTNEVIDLEARLKTYRNTESQLLEMQKTAKNVTETMAVYKELTDIRYKIESVQSQLKYYSNQTDYSTVSVVVAQNNAGAMIQDDVWRPIGIFKNALRAFVHVLKGIGSLLIWLIVFGIPALVLGLLVKYIVRRTKK